MPSHSLTQPAPQAYPDFEFNLRELAGAMGDFGTLIPFAIGYIAVNGLDPAGLFIMLGLTNIALGLVYRLPLPLQPKKVVAASAIAQGWSPSLVYATGFGLGLFWLFLVLTGLLRRLIKITPVSVVRGIQLALGIMLGVQAASLILPSPWLGLFAVVIVIVLRKNRYAPAAVVLMALGIGIVLWRGELRGGIEFGISLPPLTLPRLADIWEGMLLAGIAQIPLSITNAVIAAAALLRDYFPEKPVGERRLMLNMGVMNVVATSFGGMPMCHGAGGLAGQYYFGARTGGAPIMEGLIEVAIGLFLSKSIVGILSVFPMALVGGMMLLVGIRLGSRSTRLGGWDLAVCLVTALLSVLTSMAVGFVAGLALAHLVRELGRRSIGPFPAP